MNNSICNLCSDDTDVRRIKGVKTIAIGLRDLFIEELGSSFQDNLGPTPNGNAYVQGQTFINGVSPSRIEDLLTSGFKPIRQRQFRKVSREKSF